MRLEEEVLDLLENTEGLLPCHIETLLQAAKQVAAGNDPDILDNYSTLPVDPETFFTDPYYVGKTANIYPLVMESLIELNSGKYVEAVLTGGIGCGKTTIALYTLLYQLYLLSCLINPHAKFDLDPTSEIIFIFQSVNTKAAKEVGYNRFRAMVLASPYFQQHFRYNKDIESKLVFPNRIEVMPVSGKETAAIGENVVGGLIDELNYMQVVKASRKSVEGTTYDQAVSVYNSIARRRKTRFMEKDFLPGMLCLVSSKRYPGQFTDKKEEEAVTDATIYVYTKTVWELKPHTFSGVMFQMFIGDESRSPRIIDDNELVHPEDRALLRHIPVEYRTDFEDDPINALRELAGVSTLSSHPFIMVPEKLRACMGGNLNGISVDRADFQATHLKVIGSRWKNKDEPHFAHVDLGLTGDSAGVVIGHVSGFEKIVRESFETEILPKIVIDMVLEVPPPKGAEILFWKIRKLFYSLKKVLKVNLKWITYDSYQSVDSLQLLRQQGFVTGTSSMDATRLPYDVTKTAIYDGRVTIPLHKQLRVELLSLEDNPEDGKIDHPPSGSKDLSDALAGVVYGLTTRKELWVRWGIPIVQIPQHLAEQKDKLRKGADPTEAEESAEVSFSE